MTTETVTLKVTLSIYAPLVFKLTAKIIIEILGQVYKSCEAVVSDE